VRTQGMEEHLIRMYRLTKETGYTRVSDVAEALFVKPSSVSKMVQRLEKSGYVMHEKYGKLVLTEKGRGIGEKLYARHQMLVRFLRQIGVPENQIEREVEHIEHAFSWGTLERIQKLMAVLETMPDWLGEEKQNGVGIKFP